jgi:hypothetical protein
MRTHLVFVINMFVFILFGCYTPPPSTITQPPSIPYWYLDVPITNSFSETSSQQRAFFFRDLRSMEALTGFPRDDLPGESSTSYSWNEPLYNVPPYVELMIALMRSEGFGVSFVLTNSGTSINGIRYWNYLLLILRNDVAFFTFKTRNHNPIRF